MHVSPSCILERRGERASTTEANKKDALIEAGTHESTCGLRIY